MTEIARQVLYLDIDGTVRQGKDDALGRFVNGPEDVVVFPEAVDRMREWEEAGGLIVGVSNQGGIALGIVTANDVAHAMAETHRQTGNRFDLISHCAHHPDAEDPEMAGCWCRKPGSGAIATAAEGLRRKRSKHAECYPPHLGLMVGDRPEDLETAKAACLPFMWADDWRANGPDGGKVYTPKDQ